MKTGTTLPLLAALTLACSTSLAIAGDAPVFTQHPQSVMVAIGDTVRLSCLAMGTPPISYIWKRENTFLTDQTNALLVITNVQPGHSGRYRAIASNDDGLAQSDTAEVIVCTNMPCNFPWVWVETLRGEATNCNSYLDEMVTDGEGNIYLTGAACTTNGSTEWLTVKLNPNGQPLWRTTYADPSQYGDSPMAMEVDHSGNCYVAGYSFRRNHPPEIDQDYLTIKYGPNGDQLWAACYDSGPLQTDQARAIAVDDDGNMFVTGNHGTLKYDSEGNPLWTNSSGGLLLCLSSNDNSVVIAPLFDPNGVHAPGGIRKLSGDGDVLWTAPVTNVQDLCVDSAGNVYAAASFGYNWFESRGDIQTVKLDSNGIPAWNRIYDDPNSIELPVAMDVDQSGNVAVVGITVPPSGNGDLLLLKYSSIGNFLWATTFNDAANLDENPTDLCSDEDGNIYVAGASQWDAESGDLEGLLLKYDSLGNLLWQSHYRGGLVGTENFTHISIGQDSTMIVGGWNTFYSDWYYNEFIVVCYDQTTPRLVMGGVPAPGVRQGCLVSPRWAVFDLLARTNLLSGDWEPIGTVTNFNGLVPFFDADADEHPMRFYRAMENMQ